MKSQSFKNPDGMLGHQFMNCSLKLKRSTRQRRETRTGDMCTGRKGQVSVILAAMAQLMELGNIQIGKRKGKGIGWGKGFCLGSGSHLATLKSHPIGIFLHLLEYNPYPTTLKLVGFFPGVGDHILYHERGHS